MSEVISKDDFQKEYFNLFKDPVFSIDEEDKKEGPLTDVFGIEIQPEKKETPKISYDLDILNEQLNPPDEKGFVNINNYVDNMMEMRLAFEDKKMPYPEMLETGQKIKTNRLTPEDIYNDKTLMKAVRNFVSARYGPNLIERLTGLNNMGTTAATNLARKLRGFQYFEDMDDRKIFERWQNHMRSWDAGNFFTVGTEINAGLLATEEERAAMSAGYTLFDLQDNVFKGAISGTGNYKEMGDALYDYTKSTLFDPLNLMSFGLTKLLTSPFDKQMKTSFKEMQKGYYKRLINSGVSKEVARKKVRNAMFNRGTLASTMAFVLPDLALSVGVDLTAQLQLINVGNQEELDTFRAVTTGLIGTALPLTVGFGTVTYRKLKELPMFEKYFLNYEDILDSVQKSKKKFSTVVKEKVLLQKNILIDAVDNTFGVISGSNKDLKKWEEAKQAAIKLLKDTGKQDQDIANSENFLREFFYGVKDKNGDVITKGYIEALVDAGWMFSKDLLDDDQKATNILADTITYLDDEVIERIMKAYEAKTGISLNLDYNGQALKSRYITLASTGARVNQITSAAVRSNFSLHKDMQKSITDLALDRGGLYKDELLDTPKRGRFLLGTYKRLLTAHPGTTGANLRGFVALSLADQASEAFTSAVNIAQSGLYKVLGDQDKATYYARQSYGNFMSALRRGVSVLDPALNVAYARIIIDLNPKVYSRIFRDIAGDGGPLESLSLFNMDSKTNPVLSKLDSFTKGVSHISLNRLQDEYTKLFAFSNNLNKRIMQKYGVSPKVFFTAAENTGLINTKEFLDEVLMPAAYQTGRQTASVNWSTINVGKGKNFFREVASGVEFLTNKTPAGIIAPFGSFMNTVLATFGDYSGFNFLRFSVEKSLGKKLDPESQVIHEAFGKMAVGWTYLMYRTFYDVSGNGNSAIEKVATGRSYNQNRDDVGGLNDSQFDWPINQVEMAAQVLAHAISGDGRDVMRDMKNLNPLDGSLANYIAENFNASNIPAELLKELSLSLGVSAIRDTDRFFQSISQSIYDLSISAQADGGLSPSHRDIINIIADGFGKIIQGSLRPAEPYDVINNLFNNDGKIPDLRQGNQRFNEAFKYIDGMFSDNLPDRYFITQGYEKRKNLDVSKILFMARRTPENTLGKMMLNSAEYKDWKFSRWKGDPEVKNAMDKIAAPIFESIAAKVYSKNPDFFRKDFKDKVGIVNFIEKKLKEKVKERFINFAPQYLQTIAYISKQPRKKIAEAKAQYDVSGYDLDEILNMPDGLEVLESIKFFLEEYDEREFRRLDFNNPF